QPARPPWPTAAELSTSPWPPCPGQPANPCGTTFSAPLRREWRDNAAHGAPPSSRLRTSRLTTSPCEETFFKPFLTPFDAYLAIVDFLTTSIRDCREAFPKGY